MRLQQTFNAYTWPPSAPDAGKVDIRLGPTALPPHTGDLVKFNGATYYYREESPAGPDALYAGLTDGETTYTAPAKINDTDTVAAFTGVSQATLLGVVHAVQGRLKANS